MKRKQKVSTAPRKRGALQSQMPVARMAYVKPEVQGRCDLEHEHPTTGNELAKGSPTHEKPNPLTKNKPPKRIYVD
jgi:hypothetical protein